MSKNDTKSLQPVNGELVEKKDSPTEMHLGSADTIDLSGLTESQVQELKMQYNKGIIDIKNKALELQVDVAALDKTLSSFNDQTVKATESNTHATITHAQTSSLGRTEAVIGNTDKARAGKLSRSARGESDKTLMIIGIVVAAAIVLAMILKG